ncbi:MAG: Crp/Fnr family transcriptional regulator [Elusimicrobia bacterium]|nr:Crp/Fnr family transcriptional regulator [Elusimicrobiota bacterium]
MELRLLRRIPFLKALPPVELKRIARIATEIAFRAGETIFSKSESGSRMFVVISGRIRIFTSSHAKKQKTFAYLDPGDLFGEMSLVDGHTRSASARAETDSRLLVIRKSDFKGLLFSDPKLCFFLLRTVSERLRQANEEIENLLFRNMLGRVSGALNALVGRGRRFRGGVLLKDRYTQQELADMVGTTREPLSRAISSLRRAQILDMHHGRYFVRDPRRLAELCHPLPS